MIDPRYNPTLLRDYLLGGYHCGLGLLERVNRAAQLLAFDPGPLMARQWMIGGWSGGGGSYHNNDDIVELAFYLAQWRGVNRFQTAKHVISWLAASHAGDIGYLDNQIEITASRIEHMLHPNARRETIDHCLALMEHLKNWIGTSCNHAFRTEHKDVGYEIVKCIRCNFIATKSIFPYTRCDVCLEPMGPLPKTGRPRFTCSGACRKKKSRLSVTKAPI